MSEAEQARSTRLFYRVSPLAIGEGNIIRTIGKHYTHFFHYHMPGVPGRHDLDDTQELAYPPIIKALAATSYGGYVGHEFIPKGDPVAALENAYRIG